MYGFRKDRKKNRKIEICSRLFLFFEQHDLVAGEIPDQGYACRRSVGEVGPKPLVYAELGRNKISNNSSYQKLDERAYGCDYDKQAKFS